MAAAEAAGVSRALALIGSQDRSCLSPYDEPGVPPCRVQLRKFAHRDARRGCCHRQGLPGPSRGDRFSRSSIPTPRCGSSAAAPARRPVSRVLYRGLRRGDGHPSEAAGCPTAHAADPRAGQRTSPPGEPGLRPPIWPCSGWSLPRFTPAPTGRHRHCGTGPRLTADGRYPPPCAGELGLSSRRPVARPARDHPAASLARAL